MNDEEGFVVFCLVEKWCDVCVRVGGECVVLGEMDDAGLGGLPK